MMRKSIMIVIGFLCLMMLPKLAFAVDYSIEEMTIDVHLQEDGTAIVTEIFTYDFPSSFNGMIRTLQAKDHTSITNVVATEDETSLTVEQDGNDYLIHRQGENEKVTAHLTYTIEAGVDIYNDIGEFYWSFFDGDNPSDYEEMTINVYPPSETTDVIALGYGAAEDIAEISPNGQVEYYFGKVKSGVGADIRTAYDRELFPQAVVTEDTFMREQLINEQTKQSEAREVFLQRQTDAKKMAPYIIAIFGGYFLILIIYVWRKEGQLKADLGRRYSKPFFVPEGKLSLPATILYMRGLLTGEALTAALFDLVRKGNIMREDENILRVKNESVDYEHERLLINWLFYTIGSDGEFKLDDLKTYINEEINQEQYQKDHQTWQLAVSDELLEYDLYENNNKQRILIGLSSLLLIPCAIYLAVYEQWLFVALSGGLFLCILLFAMIYRPRTLLGKKIKDDWNHFKNNYVTVENKGWAKLQDDEQRRAFIYSLGMSDKKMSAKNESLFRQTNRDIFPGVDVTTLMMISMVMNSQFNHANQVSAQTSDASTMSTFSGVGGSGGGSSAF